MADAVAYRFCRKCKKAVLRQERRCPHCNASMGGVGTKLLVGVMVALVGGALLLRAVSPQTPAISVASTSPQQGFMGSLAEGKRQLMEMENPIKQLAERETFDRALRDSVSSGFVKWSAAVTGLSVSGTAANVSVDIGGVTLKSGVSTSGGYDTQIRRGTPLYGVLAELAVGDEVLVSGEFSSSGSGLVSLSFLDDPYDNFSVSFTSIEKRSP